MELTLTIQGWYYVLTGTWPLIHMKSLESITGPKTDHWLVKTVGLLIVCSGTVFLIFRDTSIAEQLAILNALVMAGVDIYYSSQKLSRRSICWTQWYNLFLLEVI
jgi:hypothetical protein